MPGCLPMDGMWQLTGFFLGWLGSARSEAAPLASARSSSRAKITQDIKRLEYTIDIKRVIARKLKLVEADGSIRVDGEVIYTAKDMRVLLKPGQRSAEFVDLRDAARELPRRRGSLKRG